jgi:DNA-binding LacI/PurR family transcriptional regulator
MAEKAKRTKHNTAVKPDRMDIRSVAEAAGVSVATVSRAMNYIPSVNPKMAKRVWKAIRELNYLPNSQARGLVSGRSRLLGLIVSEVKNPFFQELIQGFEEVAVEHGYDILIGSLADDAERMRRCVQRMAQRKVEGIAVLTFGTEESLASALTNCVVPLVFVDLAPQGPDVIVLGVDYQFGIRQAVQHLAALGHRDIAFVAGPLQLYSAQSRLAAFRTSLQECGIPVDDMRIIEGDHTMQGGTRAAERLLGCESLPTAIMCSNDLLAIGVLHKLSRNGIRVPDDISVIGFDDIHMAEMTIPPLTSIQMSRPEMARSAVCALRAQIEHSSSKQRYEINTRLVVRESTGFPRGAVSYLSRQKGQLHCPDGIET